MTTATYTVQGMTCQHCVNSVTEEVSEIAGVRRIDVDLATGTLTVTTVQPVDEGSIRTAVQDAGYQLVGS